MATNGYNEHLNPRPYLINPVVKFHIQKVNDVQGVAMCGGIYSPDRFSVFSANFVMRFDEKNQCKCCVAELYRETEAEKFDRIENYEIWASLTKQELEHV